MTISKFFISLVVVGLLFLPLFFVSATETVEPDNNVTAEELDVKAPKLLPTSSFYFLKDWWRGAKSIFTFDKIEKEDLRLRQMNERLIEVQELFEQPVDKKSQQAITKVITKYKKQAEKFQERTTELKEKLDGNEDINRLKQLISKNADWELKRQYLLQKVEGEEGVNQEVKDLLESAMQESLGGLATTMSWWQRATEVKEALSGSINKASQLRQMYNLETLKRLGEQVTDETKEMVDQAQVESLEQLEKGLEKSDQIYKDNLLQEFIKSNPSPQVMQQVSNKVQWKGGMGKIKSKQIKVEENTASEAISETLDLFAAPELVQ